MGKFIDLTGQRFGKLVVIERAENRGKHVYWKCQCDCGAIHEARVDGLRNGSTRSCGHCDFEDLTGKRFGRRVVLKRAADRFSSDGYPMRFWLCQCDCGSINEVGETFLIHGKSQSCGCLVKDMMREKQTKHNHSDTRLYSIWCNMKGRTTNQNDPAWNDYGGRGITICDEWKNSFETFYDWANQNGYTDSLTIERVDVNGNYEPSNCRWATRNEQARNKRNTVYITYNNQTLNAFDWSEIIGLSPKTIKQRYHDGWSPERILTTPYSARTPIPVRGIDNQGNVVEYQSMKEAARNVNTTDPTIRHALDHPNYYVAGYRWEFVNQEDALVPSF